MGLGKLGTMVLLAATLWTPPLVKSGRCLKKPVDSCGCHHVFGVRHCHPSRRTNHCEARASWEPEPEPAPQPFAFASDGAL